MCSGIVIVFVTVLSLPVIFLVWGVWMDRTDIPSPIPLPPSFQEMQCTE